MTKRFKFVYWLEGGEPDEVPTAYYFRANNVTNAMAKWEAAKKPGEVLIAILEGDRVVKQYRETGFQLEAVH